VTDASAVGTLSSVNVGTCEGDGNLDGSVDAADLAEMLLSYGEASVYDLDGSGITDNGDTALLLLNWGPCSGSTGGGTTGGGTTDSRSRACCHKSAQHRLTPPHRYS
jgi:hypothetical protein